MMQDILVVGGHINHDNTDKGNVFNVPSNKFAELNMFLDPLAAKTVLSSELNITLIPLGIQRKFSAFPTILKRLHLTKKTPEVIFVKRLLSTLHQLQKTHPRYKHMVYNPLLICIKVFLRIPSNVQCTNSVFC